MKTGGHVVAQIVYIDGVIYFCQVCVFIKRCRWLEIQPGIFLSLIIQETIFTVHGNRYLAQSST